MNRTQIQRPRVLFVAPEVPHPPFTGAHTRPLSIIRALADDYDVTVVGAAPAGADLSALDAVGARVVCLDAAPYARSPLRVALAGARQLVSPVPLIGRGYSAAIGRLVRDATARVRPDVLHLVSMYSCWYRDDRLPAVIDLSDVVSGLCDSAAAAHPMRYGLARLQERSSANLERRELAKMAAVIAINAEDADRLRRLGVESTVVPLSMSVPADAELAGPATGSGPLRILFVGSFLHHPNRASAAFLARELVPALRRSGLAFALTIAGRAAERVAPAGRAADRVAPAGRAADRVALESGGGGIEYVADVPDLGRLYRSADIVLAPIVFGGGTKNKTLEAMAWGKPVIGTPLAFTGIDAREGAAFVSTPLDGAAMASAVVRLAGDPLLRAAVGKAGRDYVLESHTQGIVDERVRLVYERVLKPRA